MIVNKNSVNVPTRGRRVVINRKGGEVAEGKRWTIQPQTAG